MTAIFGVTLKGIEAVQVEVETEITGGLFTISVVGLPDPAVREARERVRAALRSVGVMLRGRVAVNLAPADLPKEGALLDLPMALGMALKEGTCSSVASALYMGELALDGRLRYVRGAVPAALLAKHLDMPLYVPEENAREVALVPGVTAYSVGHLGELLYPDDHPPREPLATTPLQDTRGQAVDPDFSDIKGQDGAKRAVEIAAAGHHNIFMVGAPGSGKTMLARALKGILPPLDRQEYLDTLLVRSTLGMSLPRDVSPPFRVVHHTSSTVALCGGGASLRPGELSLAHRGVLFLDEFPEFRRDLLEALRQPLEDGIISISRATGSVTYPCRVLLVAAANPCPCGYLGDPVQPCRCSPAELDRYGKRLSGPMLDRIDLQVTIPRLTPEELVSMEPSGESSAVVRERVEAARERQRRRWKDDGYSCNAEIPEKLLRKRIALGDGEQDFLGDLARQFHLTGRGLSRILRLSRTIADLQCEDGLTATHLAEAVSYRCGVSAWTPQ
ncbi:MAG: YifB family Mg chelatase-like AAA ATPase [Synergistales bacterium]|nr:YifB family Mg chelatase-like AAA ATPase [Synergistales bacterium]